MTRPDPVINDSFTENVKEVLEMLDRESNDQDQEQEVDKGHEATAFPDQRVMIKNYSQSPNQTSAIKQRCFEMTSYNLQ